MRTPLTIQIPNVYHEQQHKNLCCLHAINNLLQCEKYTQADFDNICYELTPYSCLRSNPHKSFYGGNYDVNVLEVAVSRAGYQLHWHDARHPFADNLDPEQVLGCVVNTSTRNTAKTYLCNHLRRLQFWKSSKQIEHRHHYHWFAMRQVDGTWYNLDSKLPRPHAYSSEEEFRAAVDNFLRPRCDGHVFLVLRTKAD
eukprot:NODE_4954_length_718_cov_26.291032_g4791_i0.p1 GENE.NODE_4954_length_718_cov_26.291032_g4791_i0~~NODE_4954_length_718_cov_26.291032_g4791_i0.p1  ORF type:complete len:214 (+),score=64.94 NODE_4954_length_718_cov_26.291032_g4791_i0:54-644(+)